MCPKLEPASQKSVQMSIPSLLSLAVHCLVVEECKWPSVRAEEISLVVFFDITGGIDAKQVGHEDRKQLEVPLKSNGIASFAAKFSVLEGAVIKFPAVENRTSGFKAQKVCTGTSNIWIFSTIQGVTCYNRPLHTLT